MALLCILLVYYSCTSCRGYPSDVNYIENGIIEAENEQFDDVKTYPKTHINWIIGENQNSFQKQICVQYYDDNVTNFSKDSKIVLN